MRNKVAVAVVAIMAVAVVAIASAIEARMGIAIVREARREASRGASLDALAIEAREAREASESMEALAIETQVLDENMRGLSASLASASDRVSREARGLSLAIEAR